MESEQLRREVDSSGPQDELEYWKKRGAQFSQLVSHVQVRYFDFSSVEYLNSYENKRFRLSAPGSANDADVSPNDAIESHQTVEGD